MYSVMTHLVWVVFFWYGVTVAEDQPTSNLTFEKPYVFISLGEGCKVAGYIRGSSLTKYAYPFDWTLSTDFESIYQVILHDFHGYMSFDNLQDLHFFDRKMNLFPDEPRGMIARWVLEKTYNLESRHDFDISQEMKDIYPDVKEKIERRIQRFYNTLARTDITIFLVRMMVRKEQAIRFRNLLKEKFPRAKFVLVVLSNTPDFHTKWHEPNIENFFFNDPVYQWDNGINNYRYNNGNCCDDWDAVVNELLDTYVRH